MSIHGYLKVNTLCSATVCINQINNIPRHSPWDSLVELPDFLLEIFWRSTGQNSIKLTCLCSAQIYVYTSWHFNRLECKWNVIHTCIHTHDTDTDRQTDKDWHTETIYTTHWYRCTVILQWLQNLFSRLTGYYSLMCSWSSMKLLSNWWQLQYNKPLMW